MKFSVEIMKENLHKLITLVICKISFYPCSVSFSHSILHDPLRGISKFKDMRAPSERMLCFGVSSSRHHITNKGVMYIINLVHYRLSG